MQNIELFIDGAHRAAEGGRSFTRANPVTGEIATTAAAAWATLLKGGVPKPVIGCAFLRVFQCLVGSIHIFEVGLSLCITRIAIRMVLHGFFAVGTFESLFIGAPIYSQYVVKVGFGHLEFTRLWQDQKKLRWRSIAGSVAVSNPSRSTIPELSNQLAAERA